jgi:RTX calcium-binding nonapeptide repeat (4 copies)
MLRRVVLLYGALLVGVIVLGGVALAEVIRGTFKKDELTGTNQLDRIYGLGAADTISGLAGNDDCYGGSGFDVVSCGPGNDRIDGGFGQDDLFGGPGDDTILAADGQEDRVNCGVGTDTAYVDGLDRVNDDCENVFVAGGGSGPNPVVDKVSGRGELGSAYGSPRLRVNAESAGTNPDDAQGTFSITYPGDPDVARDNTYVRGTILCLAVSGNEARLVGQIVSASGPRADNGTFQKDEYVRIGVLDNATNDKANFSPGEQTFTSCNGETPNLDVLEGNFVVEEGV